MTNYNTSYDTMDNYQEPVNQTPEARASESPLENAVNTEVPELPTQARKKMPTWKKVLIGALIGGCLTTSYVSYKVIDAIGQISHIENWKWAK